MVKRKDVTLEELVSGYQKGDDYTKKSQTLAETKSKGSREAKAHPRSTAIKERNIKLD